MFTFQKCISNVLECDDIPVDLVVNLDKTSLTYVSPSKYSFNPSGFKTVVIKGINDKRQITATFAVTMTSKFVPVQTIYEEKTH